MFINVLNLLILSFAVELLLIYIYSTIFFYVLLFFVPAPRTMVLKVIFNDHVNSKVYWVKAYIATHKINIMHLT